MSGICGLIRLDEEPVTRAVMETMTKALAHHGPDGIAYWRARNAGLAHLMLWTTPESLHEQLPLVTHDGYFVLTCDARLDNREELLAQLDLPCGKESPADSAVILAAYRKWGAECPARLIGDYVFAIWDAPARKLFAARDPLGVKHFYYYYQAGKMFALASEVKGLLALPEVPRRLNETLVADFLLPTYEDKRQTLYRDIWRLPATHSLTLEDGHLSIRQYWEPDFTRELKLRSDGEYAEAFRELFATAVRDRLRSAFPVGSMLSGGLDSSAIVSMGSQILADAGRAPLHSFSAVFPSWAGVEPACDESRYARAVAEKSVCQAHYIAADAQGPLHEVEKILWHADNTVSAPNIYMDWALYRAAQAQGVRVLLSGTDGDTTVSYGYEDFAKLARRGRWWQLYREARALSVNMPRKSHTLTRLAWSRGLALAIPDAAWRAYRAVRRRPAPPDPTATLPDWVRNRPLSPAFASRIGVRQRYWQLEQEIFPPQATSREIHWRALSRGMFGYLLESLEKAGAAFQLDLRYPFFDRRLIEFCMALPPGQKIRGGWTRSIMRRGLSGVLPPEVRWRQDKSDISAHFKRGLIKYHQDILEEVVYQSPEVIQEYIDIDALRAGYQRYVAAPAENEPSAFATMMAVYLSLWLRAAGFHSSAPLPASSAAGVGAVSAVY